jgi:hypothetical protein
MKDHWKKVGPVWKMLSLGLVVSMMAATLSIGCDSELFDDQIWPIDETREECYDEPETWRCTGDVAELCRNGYWNPWYNCAWNGGTCETVAKPEEGQPEAGCVDPPDQAIQCDTEFSWDSHTDTVTQDPDTSDTDTGYDPDTDTDDPEVVWVWTFWNVVVPETCMLCEEVPTDPEQFLDGPHDPNIPDPLPVPSGWMMPAGPTNGVLGCCSVATGNAYWGEDNVVLQDCQGNGCCAYIDYTSTLDDPSPVYHACCP